MNESHRDGVGCRDAQGSFASAVTVASPVTDGHRPRHDGERIDLRVVGSAMARSRPNAYSDVTLRAVIVNDDADGTPFAPAADRSPSQ